PLSDSFSLSSLLPRPTPQLLPYTTLFRSPTVIAGDKSLVSVIAHELAHSWAGNLAGNATWRDFWLNEGLTDYMESRIMTAVTVGDRKSTRLNSSHRTISYAVFRLKKKK